MNICLNKLLEGRFKLGLEAKLLLRLLQFTHATRDLQTNHSSRNKETQLGQKKNKKKTVSE